MVSQHTRVRYCNRTNRIAADLFHRLYALRLAEHPLPRMPLLGELRTKYRVLCCRLLEDFEHPVDGVIAILLAHHHFGHVRARVVQRLFIRQLLRLLRRLSMWLNTSSPPT